MQHNSDNSKVSPWIAWRLHRKRHRIISNPSNPLLQHKGYKNTSFVSSPTKKPNIEDEDEEFAAGYDDDTESASFLDDDIPKGDNLYEDVMTGKKISL